MGAAAATPRAVLDASAVIALFLDEPGASQLERLLRERVARMSVVNAAEVVDVLVRRHGRAADEVADAVDELAALVPASADVAMQAGGLRARLFDRRSRRVSLADCFVLATAERDEAIVTTDETLAATARDEGLDVAELSG